MDLFWRLLFGHFLADFTFQTNKINKWKRESTWGTAFHSLMHPFFYALLTYPYLMETWIRWKGISLNGLEAITLITLTHFVEDFWRVYTIKRFNTPDNTLYLLWDQVIHIAVIFIFCGVGPSLNETFIPEVWPILGILAVGATHLSVVLVYFLENDLYKASYPGAKEKYLAIGERLLAYLSLVFISSTVFAWLLAIVSLAAPRLELRAILKTKNIANFSWITGSLIAIICGFIGRVIYGLPNF